MNPAKIYALSLDGVVIHERFLPSISENLVSLYFYHMNRNSIDRILRHLPTVNRIKTLCIYQERGPRRTTTSFCDFIFFKHGHRLTSLINCSLKGFHDANQFPIITVTFSKLRRLWLSNFYWTENFVQFLRENTPNLRSLYFHRTIPFSMGIIPSVVKHIQELDMNVIDGLIDLEDILSVFPCLKRLRIFWDNTAWSAIFDVTQWQEIIEKYLPYLQHFTLDFAIGINEDVVKTFYAGEFWTTRKAVMKLIMNKVKSPYPKVKTIYFGQQWHFKYFDWSEVKNRGDGRNLNLRLQSSSLPTRFRRTISRSPAPLRLWSESRSPLSSHSRSYSRPRPRLRSHSKSRSRLRPRSRLRSRSRSQLRQQLRKRSRPRPCLRPRSRSKRRQRLRSRSRSRLRSPLRRQLRHRSRSSSRLRSRPRLRPRSRSQRRQRLRSRSRSQRRQRLRSRSRSQRRQRLRSRSRSQRRQRLRSRSRSRLRSPPRRKLRRRSRSSSRSRLRSRVRPQSRSRTRLQS